MRIDDKCNPDDVPIPARELEAVTTPTKVRAHDDHLAVMGQIRTLRISPCQQELMNLHDPVNAFVINQSLALVTQQTVQDRRNPPIAVCGAPCNEITDQRNYRCVLRFMVAPTRLCIAFNPLDQIGARNAKRLGNRIHRKSSFSSDAESNVCFFNCDLARASFKISISMVLRPKRRSRSRTRSSSLRTS